MDESIRDALRALPSIDTLLASDVVHASSAPHSERRAVARAVVERARLELRSGTRTAVDSALLAEAVRDALDLGVESPLPPVLNATGIVLHTGLGRAPLAPEALAAMTAAAAGFAPVELRMNSGRRGRRAEVVESLLSKVTGAEAGTVVNNNAAATTLTVAALAGGRDVIVSRGELVEIGGSFRLPDVIEAGGARLREIGTTNRTRISDYARAVDERVGVILKVHPSNYRVSGFTAEVEIADLVALGREHGIPVVHDVGSGALHDLSDLGLGDEPVVPVSTAAGADAVLFSGDKLVGGPQSGIVVGTRAAIDLIEQHPLMRACRVDKLTLAALGATLVLHEDSAEARKRIPGLRMLAEPVEMVRSRAEALASDLVNAGFDASVTEATAYAGGGSVPEQALASAAVRVSDGNRSEDEIAARFRAHGIVGRIHDSAFLLDARTLGDDAVDVTTRLSAPPRFDAT